MIINNWGHIITFWGRGFIGGDYHYLGARLLATYKEQRTASIYMNDEYIITSVLFVMCVLSVLVWLSECKGRHEKVQLLALEPFLASGNLVQKT